jgi:hypothetical protein
MVTLGAPLLWQQRCRIFLVEDTHECADFAMSENDWGQTFGLRYRRSPAAVTRALSMP